MTPDEAHGILRQYFDARAEVTGGSYDRVRKAVGVLANGTTSQYWAGFHVGQQKAADLLLHVLSEEPVAAMAFLDSQTGQEPENQPVGAGTAQDLLRVARAILALRGRGGRR